MVSGGSHRAAPARVARWALGACALGVFALYLARVPLSLVLPQSGLGLPDAAALGLLLRTALGLLLLNLAAWGFGRPLLGRLAPGSPVWLEGASALGLGWLVLASAVLGLAALRWLGVVPLALLLLLGVGCALPGLGRALPGLRRGLPGAASGRLRWPLVALAGALLAAPLLRAFGPDPGWDALTYHLALPERFLFENRLVVTPFSVFSVFPLAAQMLYLVAVAFDVAPLANWLHLEFGVLAAWLVFALARQTSARAGWLALACLAADPLFSWELGVAYVDLAACFYTLLAAAWLLRALDGHALRTFALCGVFAGAAASVRYPSWAVPPVLVAWVCLSPAAVVPRERLRAAAAVAGAAALVLLPWLVRNWIATGNPVAPAFQGWFHSAGEEYFAPVALAQNAAFIRSIGLGRGLLDLLLLPWNLTLRVTPGDYAGFAFQIGVLPLIGLGVLGVAGRRGVPVCSRRLLAVAGLLAVFWFYTGQDPRYLLPALALLAVPVGVAADALIPRAGWGRAWLALPLLAVLQTQAASLASLPYAWATGLGGAAVDSNEAAQRVGEGLRGQLTAGDRLLLVLEPRGWYFRGLDYVPHHLADGSPVLLGIHEAAGRGALAERFAEWGVTHVLVNSEMPGRMAMMFVPDYSRADFAGDMRALERHLAAHAEPVLVDGPVSVHRLREASQ